jgi:hypothetical protein
MGFETSRFINDPTGTAKLAAAQNGDKQEFGELVPFNLQPAMWLVALLEHLHSRDAQREGGSVATDESEVECGQARRMSLTTIG